MKNEKELNFQNVAIKCDTWQQMQHLAKLAEAQGKDTSEGLFNEEDFNVDGSVYFVCFDKLYCNLFDVSIMDPTLIKITYTSFINSHPDISVEGC